ncbi:hypothetical protein BTO04_10410 [Polaribacter sp. SA4-10]|nr:hypothetical protein BTO04_10410 [Polaribacter sp. SA4-10]
MFAVNQKLVFTVTAAPGLTISVLQNVVLDRIALPVFIKTSSSANEISLGSFGNQVVLKV